jgi:crotonobetainyl-CoA:carnitine CoA-transferase CaiB-like acyl-CoA transferase
MANPTPERTGALIGVRVIDLTDERGIYGAKLLADLGADVIRPEPPEGDPLRHRGPHVEPTQGASTQTDGCDTSLWHAFFASSRRFMNLNLTAQADIAKLRQLVGRADIVLSCEGAFGVNEADLGKALSDRDDLIVIDTTSFGKSGEWAHYLAPDLIAGALGGSLATTGDVDTPPLKSFGELNFMVSGAYIAIAALASLFHVRRTRVGQRVDISVHECIASCLEHVFMFQWYSNALATAKGPVLPRRGALHWSNAYDVLQAQGGSIMVTPTPDWDSQLMWLIEEDAHEDLIDPKYTDPDNALQRIERTMDILQRWVADKDVESLFFEAQQRHSPYGWVLPIEKLAENPQLQARNWFIPYAIGETRTQGTGAPFHFSRTPWDIHGYEPVDGDSADLMTTVGWTSR